MGSVDRERYCAPLMINDVAPLCTFLEGEALAYQSLKGSDKVFRKTFFRKLRKS